MENPYRQSNSKHRVKFQTSFTPDHLNEEDTIFTTDETFKRGDLK